MKKTIIALFLVSSAISTNTLSHDNDYALLAAGLVGLALIVGDGHTSFGVHYDRGYYNYRGHRYSNRVSYLRAVSLYERQRQYYSRYGYNSSRYYSNDSRSRYNDNYRSRNDERDSRSNNSRSTRSSQDRSNDRDDSRDNDRRSSRN